jgi:hypothetical protein
VSNGGQVRFYAKNEGLSSEGRWSFLCLKSISVVKYLSVQNKELKRMNELQAKQIAEALSGEIWQSGGGIWLVLLRQGNGKLVVISDEIIINE